MKLSLPMTRFLMLSFSVLCVASSAQAGPIREMLEARKAARGAGDTSASSGSESGRAGLMERLQERKSTSGDDQSESELTGARSGKLHSDLTIANVKRFKDVAYGSGEKETYDVFAPEGANNAPMLVMVHGGGWFIGDKRHEPVILNKGNYYVGKGFVFVSVNYPMLPDAKALDQANYVAKALAHIQNHAGEWGGNPKRLVLMGHSAGGHIVSLLGADPSRVTGLGGMPWKGTVSLDSAAMNVVTAMNDKHYSFYDRAFGTDQNYWVSASPYHQLKSNATPFLAVCSSKRTASCPPNHQFSDKLNSMGVMSSVHEEPLKHGDINDQVGTPGALTNAVDSFISAVLK